MCLRFLIYTAELLQRIIGLANFFLKDQIVSVLDLGDIRSLSQLLNSVTAVYKQL